ncbi:MAG: hypothetical protein HQM15_09500 [Deltaproteobacteria bacterium]|nr:hypothetical protein [Deltaproteobacteria bacterium]
MSNKKTVSKVFGIFLLGVLVSMFVLLEGGHLIQLLQPLTLAFILGITICGSIFSVGAQTTVAGVLNSLVGIQIVPISNKELELYAQRIKGIIVSSTILVAVLGFIQILQHLDNMEEVGHGAAVCLISIVYGTILALILPATVYSNPSNPQ